MWRSFPDSYWHRAMARRELLVNRSNMKSANHPCQDSVTDTVFGVPPGTDPHDFIDWEEVEWEALLEEWSAELDGDRWITLAEAEVETGMSRSALRSWYRSGQIRSRMVDGPNGPQRLVPRDAVRLRAALAARRKPGVKLDDEVGRLSSEVERLTQELESLSTRLADLEKIPPKT